MQDWNEQSEQVSKIAIDEEKAKSLLQLIALREKNLQAMNKEEMATLVVETYYEIIKELITAIMSLDGWKTVSHELLVGYLAKFYKEFSQAELYLIDQLRKIRNDIAYRGVIIKKDYLTRNDKAILAVTEKLKQIVRRKL
ncbi:MAG: hypothetical protein AABX75_01600 [Nanoarchaeota archaeon]